MNNSLRGALGIPELLPSNRRRIDKEITGTVAEKEMKKSPYHRSRFFVQIKD